MGFAHRGPQPPLAGAPQRLLRRAGVAPGCRAITTDVCVPVSQLASCIEQTIADVAGLPFPAPLLGHVADGNFHLLLLIDPDDPGERRTAEAVYDRLVARAHRGGRHLLGEHGVGLGKRRGLADEAGPAIEVMQRLKRPLDPAGLFNPDKVLRRVSQAPANVLDEPLSPSAHVHEPALGERGGQLVGVEHVHAQSRRERRLGDAEQRRGVRRLVSTAIRPPGASTRVISSSAVQGSANRCRAAKQQTASKAADGTADAQRPPRT